MRGGHLRVALAADVSGLPTQRQDTRSRHWSGKCSNLPRRPTPPLGQSVNRREAAALLACSMQTVTRLIRAGRLKATDIGLGRLRHYRIALADLRQFQADSVPPLPTRRSIARGAAPSGSWPRIWCEAGHRAPKTPRETMDAINCPRCKTRLPKSAAFCRRCGTALHAPRAGTRTIAKPLYLALWTGLQATASRGSLIALVAFVAILAGDAVRVFRQYQPTASGRALAAAPPSIRRDTAIRLAAQPQVTPLHWQDAPMVSPWPQGVQSDPKAPPPLPASELAKVEGTATVALGELTCTLDNRSNWMIFNLAILVTVTNADGTIALTRILSNPDNGLEVSVMPPQRGNGLERLFCNGPLGAPLGPGQTWTWSIAGARGRAATPEFMEGQDKANGYTEHRDPETGTRIAYDFISRRWVDVAE